MFSRGYQFPEVDVRPGHVHHNKNKNKYFRFVGGNATDPASWKEISTFGIIPRPNPQAIPNDPDIRRWGEDEVGFIWYNSTTRQLKMWTGQGVKIL